jgi:hypothetical protein
MDMDALDHAVNGWLMATRRFVATHEDSAMRLEATVLPGRFHLSGTVTFERRTRCGSAVLSAGTAYRVIARLMPDGEFSGRAELRNGGIVTLEGALMAMDEMRVTVRYQRPPAGCEVGPFTVAARIAS